MRLALPFRGAGPESRGIRSRESPQIQMPRLHDLPRWPTESHEKARDQGMKYAHELDCLVSISFNI